MKIKSYILLIFSLTLFCSTAVFAASYDKDLYIGTNDVKVPANILQGDKIKIYTTVHNSSSNDLSGVVKFYNEKTKSYFGSDQPISVLPKKTDDVFIDFNASIVGEHTIAIRVVPWNASGDDPGNNKIIKKIYVDIDSDKDGKGNRIDTDDDNDGVLDKDDDFPLDPTESKDTDKDGIGNNKDTDDDNDGVEDVKDAFPLDPKDSKDTDKDGVGDNQDVFPLDPKEWKDSDKDGLGDNADTNDANKGPIPSIEVPNKKLKVNKDITFKAINSKDPDGKIIEYAWNFGDSKTDTGVIVNHSYEKFGEYLVTLKVTDDKKESRTQQMKIKVGYNWMMTIIISLSLLLLLIVAFLIYMYSRRKKTLQLPKKKKK